MTNFSIIALKVLSDKSPIQKVLKKGWFLLNQSYKVDEHDKLRPNEKYPLEDDFFGKNISIGAIVGRNGSGKSSLLELFFRMVYNLSVKRGLFNDKEATFIPLKAEIYFIVKNQFCGLKSSDNSIYFFKKEIIDKVELDTSKIDWGDEIAKESTNNLEGFFYSIVVNYSLHAYISNDYDVNIKTGFSWIDYLFHKNDGYQTPLVLNPFRDRGVIDLNTEYDLTMQRLSALFINDGDFIKGYKFKNIELSYNREKILDRFTDENCTDENHIPDLTSFENNYGYDKDSIFVKILHEYGIIYPFTKQNVDSNLDPQTNSSAPTPIDIAYHYLALKTISISKTYQNYTNKKYTINILSRENVTQCQLNQSAKNYNIEGLVEEILTKDFSHVTLKIKQVLNFIEYANKNQQEDLTKVRYDYMKEDSLYKDEQNLSYLDRIIVCLPPSFYKSKIILYKEDDKEDIPISQMSSGERQFLFSMSTVLYHIKNLISISEADKDRVKYKNFNIVLDEIELCFHPEYQREFVNKLIGNLERLVENDPNKDDYHFNIILATHSPFILSDIPKCNVLFLKDGKQSDEMQENTFGANIHSLLQNAFFLNGTVGEFAKQKINDIFRQLHSGEIDDNLLTEIKLVSEPFIRSQLFKLYNELGPQKKVGDLEERIIELEKQVKKYDKNQK
jgi:predicted ATPase